MLPQRKKKKMTSAARCATTPSRAEQSFWRVWRNPNLLTYIYSFNKGWRGRCAVFAVLHDDLHTLTWQHDKFFVGVEHAAALLLRRADIYDWLDQAIEIKDRVKRITP